MMFPAKVNLSTIAAHSRGSVKIFRPSGERFVRGDRDTGSLLAFGQCQEEQFGATPVELHVAQFINAEEIDATIAGDVRAS
jgi:hypothetical protein